MNTSLLTLLSINLKYPKIIELDDGKQISLTHNEWENRPLVIETDRTEFEVRKMLVKEGFNNAGIWEIKKPQQLGDGLIKKINDWQIHIRLYLHENYIQLDAEAELSNDYLEHLSHGWISAFQTCMNIIRNNFDNVWVYHKGIKQYVTKIVSNTMLTLNDAQSKTEYKLLLALGAIAAVIIMFFFNS